MGYVPADAKWYIAEIVEEITVEGDPRNVVHVNFNLVRADSPEDAYDKSNHLGRESETEYENAKGKLVRIRFCGLRELSVIHDELEHGAELMYEEFIGKPAADVNGLVVTKERLSVFVPWKQPDQDESPDYGSKEIMEEVDRRFGLKRFDGMDKADEPDRH